MCTNIKAKKKPKQTNYSVYFCINHICPELSIICSATIGQALHQLLLIQAFRPDRLLAMSHIFVSKVLGDTFMSIIEQPLDLANIIDSEVMITYLFQINDLPIVTLAHFADNSYFFVSVGEAQHSSVDVFCARL